MRRFEIDRRGAAAFQSGLPARDADTPAIARFQSRKTPFRHWRHEIVPVENGEIQKLFRHLHADGVQPDVVRPRAAISIPIKSGHGIAATAAQVGPENIRWHGAQ